MTIVRCVIFGVVLTGAIIAGMTSQTDSTDPASIKESAVFGEWSAEVNGLQARVASLGSGRGYTDGVYLELRNVGDRAFTIPSLEVCAKEGFPWRMQIAKGNDWKDVVWGKYCTANAEKVFTPKKIESSVEPTVMLQPRESALMWIDSRLEEDVRFAAKFRLILQQSDEGPVVGWSGTLETPSASTRTSEKALGESIGKLPAPTYFPPLNRVPAFFPNGRVGEAIARQLWASNWKLLERLALYEYEPIKRELEKRLLAEIDFDLQLILAAEAARRGSDAGKAHILKAREDVDYEHCRSTLNALEHVAYRDNAPDWVFDAMIDALRDQRQITGIPSYFAEGTSFTVSYLADEDASLTRQLGGKKCQRAVPVLIDITRNCENRRHAIEALGKIGDLSAVPVLFEFVNTGDSEVNYIALQALVNLKADGVADQLLSRILDAKTVKMLEQLGDERAIPRLRGIVSEGTQVDLVGASRIALATLEPGDPIPRYCAIVKDQSLDEYTRREAIWRLGTYVDPRAIPVLLIAAREDPSGAVVDNAIVVLQEFRYADAVTGLIKLFDADFEGKTNWKYAHKPNMFREHIAESLQKITGESYGPDKSAWEEWWQAQDQSAFK